VKIIVVGAGLAGLACARELRRAGHDVTLLDKSRGAGGRMSSRRVDTGSGDVTFDHGAQYFTVRDPLFAAEVQQWAEQGLAARWPVAGPDAFVGVPAMNAPLKALAAQLDVRLNTRVSVISRDGDPWSVSTKDGLVLEAEAVIIALPAEQAAELLHSVVSDMAALARSVVSEPCWTVMAVFPGPLAAIEVCLSGKDPDVLGWAARNSAKPERGGPEAWVIQGTADWSKRHLEQPGAWVESRLLAALAERLEIVLPAPLWQTAHRWRYARSGVHDAGSLWDPASGLGVCGDWLVAPRVEGAWLSGTQLADRIGRALPS